MAKEQKKEKLKANGGFSFTKENLKRAEKEIAKYPEGRQESAVIALLRIAQEQNDNYLSNEAIEYVADFLGMPNIKALEIASFYTMFNRKPVGKHLIQICRTASCYVRGAEGITAACKKHLGVGLEEMTEDGNFTIKEVECLGACANAPVVQINDDYFEDLDSDKMIKIIDDLRSGKKVKPGSQIGRKGSSSIS